ncbi:MAG: molybdopterin oxidoreductase, partial [Clostridiales bacterium]|nr:molybdopterin oxidoreductase [Clostridiales bacterium]
QEINLGFAEADARAEAARCLECGCHDYADCKLIRCANLYEIHPERIAGEKHPGFVEQKLVCIERNQNKCILCNLCVRTCDEVAGKGILGLVGRGFQTVIRPEFNDPATIADCANCRKCAEICPTGALRIVK